MLDLALFTSSSADAEVRREAEQDDFIVKHYYAELERRMVLSAKVPPYGVKQVCKASLRNFPNTDPREGKCLYQKGMLDVRFYDASRCPKDVPFSKNI